jgi:hypothetical protein
MARRKTGNYIGKYKSQKKGGDEIMYGYKCWLGNRDVMKRFLNILLLIEKAKEMTGLKERARSFVRDMRKAGVI